jgi:heme/copper-type cytochrome/quinol oxidase subunit 2
MTSATWALALIGVAAIVISALVYGAILNRRFNRNRDAKPIKQDTPYEKFWRKETFRD